MFIFDYFRAFLVINTQKWPFLGIIMVYTRQRTGIMLRSLFRWKALVMSFSKIYKSIYKN
jgi:hypothetical protein